MPTTPTTWLDAVTVADGAGATLADTSTTVLSNGLILAAWTVTVEDPETGVVTSNIVGQMMDPLGNPLGESFLLNHDRTNELASNAQIQATDDGGFIVVYQSEVGGYHDVLITSFTFTGTDFGEGFDLFRPTAADWSASPSRPLFFDITGVADPEDPSGFDPALAVDSATSGMAVWRGTTATGESVIKGLVIDPSDPLGAGAVTGAPVTISTAAGIQGEPAIIGAGGGFFVAVTGQVADDNQILLYFVRPDGTASATGWAPTSSG
jgi:hypothetical protein